MTPTPVRNHTARFTFQLNHNQTNHNEGFGLGSRVNHVGSAGNKRQRGRGFAKAVRGFLWCVVTAWALLYTFLVLSFLTDVVQWMEAMP